MIKVTVKWWNDSKGYGFVTDGTNDYFCHYTALYGEGFKTLSHLVGRDRALRVELTGGPKGAQVTKCFGWEPSNWEAV